MALFVGRLPSSIKEYDLEDIFLKYGKLTRCDIKKGKSFYRCSKNTASVTHPVLTSISFFPLAYGFVEFDNEDDAYDAIDDVDGRDLDGVRIVVEKAKGHVRRSDERGCYNCGEEGHYARDCRERSRRRYRSPSRSPSRSRRYRRYSRSPSPQRRRHRHNSYSRSPSYHRRRSYSASVSRSPSQRRRRRDYSSYSRSRSQSPGERSYSRSPSVDERRHGDARSPPSATRDDEGSVLETPDVNQVPASTTATPFATPTDAAIIED